MNESNMKPFTSDLVDSPAAWYGRDLQNDDSWIELLTDAEVDEIQLAIKQVNSQRISMLEMKREDFPLPTLGNRLQGMARELDHVADFGCFEDSRLKNWENVMRHSLIGESAYT